ncbi:MAG: DNA methyltransferase [bacterium]
MADFKTKLYKIFEEDMRLWDKDKKELNETLLKDLIDKLDVKLIELLLNNKETEEKFFIKVKDVFVLKQNELKFFIDENKLDNSYTQYAQNIGLKVGNKLLTERDEVVLEWPFKDCILEGGMTKEDQKRNEIFFNEILAKDEIDRLLDPKALVNWKRHTSKGEEKVKELKRDKDGTIRENLVIKGNNLFALHSLKEQFAGKVKLIYIDPPYNPESAANTFTYNNNFNHSTWLTFMKNRLLAAKQMLDSDGFFVVAIDHNELFYLGILCDEIFKRENRVGVISVETNPGGRSDSEFFATSHENFLVYANDVNKAKMNNLKSNEKDLLLYNLEDEISKYKLVPLRRTGSNSTPDKRPNLCFPIYYNQTANKIFLEKVENTAEIMPIGYDSIMRVWRWSKDKIQKNVNNIVVRKSKNDYAVFVKDRIKYEKKPKTLWYGSKYDASSHGTKLLQSFGLDNEVSYPKSLELMIDIIQILSDKDSLILDYHAGSGTTANAVLQLNKEDGGNRKFILVEQMDYINTVTCGRVQKIIEQNGGGDSIYCELAKWNEEAKENIIKANNLGELIKLFDDLYETYFLNYNVKVKEFKEKIIEEEDFKNLNLNEQKKLFVEMLDLNQMYVNFSEREDKKYNIKKEDIALSEEFYNIKK